MTATDKKILAAYPDILRALQSFLDYYDQAGIKRELTEADEFEGDGLFSGDVVFNVRQARAAIAKAK